ncbi:MAG: glycoside hydrolase family 15 protein [Acidobacteriota bacterium]
MPRLEDLGLIGNCQISALISHSGEIVWCCLPRLDSEPVFSTLLDADKGGRFLVGPAGGETGIQQYVPNTNVLETRFETPEGKFRLIDFAPRYGEADHFVRPKHIIRILEPIEGKPRVRVVCEPRRGWSHGKAARVQGARHLRFRGYSFPLRLTTDVPLSEVGQESFELTERRHLVLSWGAPPTESLPIMCNRMLDETVEYWRRWVKHCNIPPLFQQEVIRSALVLKLHCFEDTGAIVAATTTSIPESPGSGRTWDYRYCWLRDSAYVLNALRLLGHFEERERFVHYLLNVVADNPSRDLAPLYRVDGTSDIEEHILEDWPGYLGEKPVRIGNAAVAHRQNDIFGEMVLALAPVMLDERFVGEQTEETLSLLELLAEKAISVAGTPDAGIWEYRSEWKPQTFSSLMCWAGADRMARVAKRHRPQRAEYYIAEAERIRKEIIDSAWNTKLKSFVGTYGSQDLDAALLQIAPLHFLPSTDPRVKSTIDAIIKKLARGGWLFRYSTDDGFGPPTVAFILCTFWLVEAVATLGRFDEAAALFERARSALSPLGLLAEDYETSNLRMWGNFPQAYSHVGLIHAAFSASPGWTNLL